ncbi:MAG: adenylate/guanylate cyclase domain-containing protein [Chloroflexota bacterium]
MAKLSSGRRKGLRDSAFAYVDPQGRRRLPINDESHVRNALSRFNQVIFEDEAARNRARTRLLNAAKRYGIVPVGFVTGQLRAHAPRELPTGALTFLMTDIESSTALLLQLEDRFSRLLADTRRISRAAMRQAGGWEVDARADEFFAVFRQSSAAIDAALSIQRRMRDHAWPDGVTVRVRMGIHGGRPTLSEGGYVGVAVHTVARISALAHGGQILVSGAALAPDLPAEITVVDLGEHHLRGIGGHALFQVSAADLPGEFPPLRVSAPDSH